MSARRNQPGTANNLGDLPHIDPDDVLTALPLSGLIRLVMGYQVIPRQTCQPVISVQAPTGYFQQDP